MSAHSRPVDARHHQLASNAIVSLAGRIAAVVLSLVMAIALFRLLGAEAYGEWSLLAAVLTATSVFDLGLPGAVEREIAASRATLEPARAGRTLGTAIVVSAVMVAVAQAGVFVWGVAAPGPLAAPWQAAWLLPPAFLLSIVALLLAASLTGLRRFGAAHGWRTAGLLTGTLSTLALAVSGMTRLEGLVAAYMCGSVVTIVGCWFSLRRAWPEARIGVHRSAFASLLHLGGAMQAASLAPLVADYAVRVIAGHRFGTAAAGLYDIAARVSIVGRSFGGALLAAVVPHSVALFEAANLTRVRALHRGAVWVMTCFMLGATAVGLIGASPIARAIAGIDSGSAVLGATIAVMLMAHLAAAAFVPALLMARAAGRPWPEAAATTAAAVIGLAVAATAPSLPWAAAAVWGTQAVAFFAAWRWLSTGLPLDGIFTGTLARLTGCALVAAVVGGALHYPLDAAQSGFVGPLLGMAAGGALYVGAAFALGLVPPELTRMVRSFARQEQPGV